MNSEMAYLVNSRRCQGEDDIDSTQMENERTRHLSWRGQHRNVHKCKHTSRAFKVPNIGFY